MTTVVMFGKEYETNKLYETEIPQEEGVLLPGPMAMARITELLKNWHSHSGVNGRWGYAYRDFFPEAWVWDWLPKDGKKIIIEDNELAYPITLQGTLPKRIAKFYKDVYGVALPPDTVSKIGDAIKLDDPSLKSAFWDITNEFNWKNGSFGDLGSCFWTTDRRVARDHITDNGGFAMRFYKDANHADTNGIARAFLIPYRDKAGKEIWIVTNGYGLTTQSICRFFATETNKSYKLIGLTVDGRWDGVVYINAKGRGYIVGEADSIRKYDAIDLRWKATYSRSSSNYDSSVQAIHCAGCGDTLDEDYARRYEDDYYCDQCYWNSINICSHCHTDARFQEMIYINDLDMYVCENCAHRHYHQSYLNSQWWSPELMTSVTMYTVSSFSNPVDVVWLENSELASEDWTNSYRQLTWPEDKVGYWVYKTSVLGVTDHNGNLHTILKNDTTTFTQWKRKMSVQPDTSEPERPKKNVKLKPLDIVVSSGSTTIDNGIVYTYDPTTRLTSIEMVDPTPRLSWRRDDTIDANIAELPEFWINLQNSVREISQSFSVLPDYFNSTIETTHIEDVDDSPVNLDENFYIAYDPADEESEGDNDE